METLEKLASGALPGSFPFNFGSEFDPGSPQSLVLALFPESVPLSSVEFQKSAAATELDDAVAAFVTSECLRVGWSGPLPNGETVESYFLKTRLRQTDTACRRLDLPSAVTNADGPWVDGIARTLQLWRRLNNHCAEPSLIEFESWDPEVGFNELITFEPAGWGLRQRLEFLVLPYLRYHGRTDLVQSWVSGAADLESVREAVFAPELAGPLLQVCIASSVSEWRTVKQVIGNIRVQSSGTGVELSWDNLFEVSAKSLEFIENLVEVAVLGKLPAPKFQQLAEWALGSADTQLDILLRFLQTTHHFSHQELAVLRKTVFSKIDEHVLAEETIRSALRNSRFMFLKSAAINDYPDIVKREAAALAREFDERSSDVHLTQVLSSLELLGDAGELKAKYEKLKAMQTAFGIDPHYALSHEPIENVSKALELDTGAYVRYTDLVNIVAGTENSAAVAEQCVEAALADDNFDAVLEFFDRKFVQKSSPTAWIVYFQAGKFLSPSWDLPRPLPVLRRQAELLSQALLICPDRDLVPVMNAWSSIELELNGVLQRSSPRHVSEAPSSAHSLDEHDVPEKSGEDPLKAAEDARDHISNLLVSGIGWAIGANHR